MRHENNSAVNINEPQLHINKHESQNNVEQKKQVVEYIQHDSFLE